MGNRIYRSNSDKILGGVCAGLAEYLDIDPTIIRIIWAVSFFSGFGFLAYVIAWIVIPQRPYGVDTYHNQTYHAPSYPKEHQSESEEITAEEVDGRFFHTISSKQGRFFCLYCGEEVAFVSRSKENFNPFFI